MVILFCGSLYVKKELSLLWFDGNYLSPNLVASLLLLMVSFFLFLTRRNCTLTDIYIYILISFSLMLTARPHQALSPTAGDWRWSIGGAAMCGGWPPAIKYIDFFFLEKRKKN